MSRPDQKSNRPDAAMAKTANGNPNSKNPFTKKFYNSGNTKFEGDIL